MSEIRKKLVAVRGAEKSGKYYDAGGIIAKHNDVMIEHVREEYNKAKRLSRSSIDKDKCLMQRKLEELQNAKRCAEEDKRRRRSSEASKKSKHSSSPETLQAVADLLVEDNEPLPNFNEVISNWEGDIGIAPLVLRYLSLDVTDKNDSEDTRGDNLAGTSVRATHQRRISLEKHLSHVKTEMFKIIHSLRKQFTIPELRELHVHLNAMHPGNASYERVVHVFGEPAFTHPEMRMRKYAVELQEESIAAHWKVAGTMSAMDALQCRYLRLVDSAVEQLVKMCHEMDMDPGLHPHTHILSPTDLVEFIFRDNKRSPTTTHELVKIGDKSKTDRTHERTSSPTKGKQSKLAKVYSVPEDELGLHDRGTNKESGKKFTSTIHNKYHSAQKSKSPDKP